MRKWLFGLLLALTVSPLFAAPADDGASAGARLWILSQARSFRTITPSDTVDFTPAPSRWVNGWKTASTDCDIAILGVDDAASVIVAVQVGAWSPIEIKRVLSTGTTCTRVVVGY